MVKDIWNGGGVFETKCYIEMNQLKEHEFKLIF